MTINTQDGQTTFNSTDNITLVYDITLKNRQYYMNFKTGIRGITLYVDGESRSTNYEDITLNNLKPGPHTAYFTLQGKTSNTLTFYVIGESEISTPETNYAYIEGVNTKIPLIINDDSGLAGTINITVKDQGSYKLLSTYFNVKNGYEISTEMIAEALESLYGTLDSSYTINITYSSKYAHSSSTEFKISKLAKLNTPISLDVQTDENNATITATVNEDATGFVKFKVYGQENYSLYVDVDDGQAILEDVLETGNYTVTATYMGNDRYNQIISFKDFTITGHVKKDTPITADVKTIGNKVTLTVNVNEKASGFVKVNIGTTVVNIELVDGVATLTTTLPADSYNAEITYLGDENYNTNATKLSFTVEDAAKENTSISLDIQVDENNVIFKVNVNSDATGIIGFHVTGPEEYTLYADLINGEAVLKDVLKVGNYTLTATYIGDSIYNANMTSKDFEIIGHVMKDTPIDVNIESNSNKVTLTATVNSDATGIVKFQIIEPEEYSLYVDVKNGQAKLENILETGNYTVIATYVGDDRYNANSTSKDFEIPLPDNPNVTVNVDDSIVSVELPKDATGLLS